MSDVGTTASFSAISPSVSEGGRVYVGFSGGLDSTVLLHWLHSQSHSSPVAVHVHHGLQPLADEWAVHCQAFCHALGIKLITQHVTVTGIAEKGIEAAARSARYEAFAGLLTSQDVLATAHHQDDQAETLLLQLLRGSGPKGLASMAQEGRCGAGRLLRPFLDLSRSRLLDYARGNGLEWIDDPSNNDTQLRRNYLRAEVMPLLQKNWPQYAQSLSRSASLQAEASVLMDDLAAIDLAVSKGEMIDSLSVTALLTMSHQRRGNLIRFWIGASGFTPPNYAHMQCVERDLLLAAQDSNPVLRWSDVELRRYRDDLVVMPSLPASPGSLNMKWDLREPLVLPAGCGSLIAECAEGAGIRLESQQLEVRFNQLGERIKPVFSKHHKRLKQLFQENAVPPWVRERLPLIYHKHCLAAVADRWVASEYAAQRGEMGWSIQWCDAPVGWLAP